MEIASFVYRQYIASRGFKKKIWFFVRKILIKWLNDPTCSMQIHGRYLKLPLSHALPSYLQSHSFYDRLPQRICEYIHQKQEHLHCIDVGANIGDTIASFYQDDRDTFLAIEPHSKFYQLLVENWAGKNNITFVPDICSSGSSKATFVIQEKNGTASILPSEGGKKMSTRPLDEIVNDYYPFAEKTNVLKIDTDGHDFEVIQGSIGLLSKCKPMVLFECDSFIDTDYVENCLRTLHIFKQCGYKHFLLYDNFGYLMGKYSLSDLEPFMNLLFYQLTSNFYYFDILVLREEEMVEFYKLEINYFLERCCCINNKYFLNNEK